jgi:hypothetical protein
MHNHRPSAKKSVRRIDVLDDPQPNKRARLTDQERETLGLLGLVPDTAEDIDQQLEWVLDQLKGKSTDLERYVYLIRLCDRNETLFFKVLMSRSLRFLLGSNCRTSLVEIALHLPSFARYLRSALSQKELHSGAAPQASQLGAFPLAKIA